MFSAKPVSFATVCFLVGCGAQARPPELEQEGEITPPAAAALEAEKATSAGPVDDASSSGNESANTANPNNEECTPRTKRECILTFRTPSGEIAECRASFEWCRADGHGWHPCGKSGVD